MHIAKGVESTAADMDSLKALNAKTYKEQAIWFLNAFWKAGPNFEENPEEAEAVWTYVAKCVELDRRGEEGNELDEFQAHQLLEKLETALTVKDMRKVLTAADVDFNKYVSLCEFLIYKYNVCGWTSSMLPKESKTRKRSPRLKRSRSPRCPRRVRGSQVSRHEG